MDGFRIYLVAHIAMFAGLRPEESGKIDNQWQL